MDKQIDTRRLAEQLQTWLIENEVVPGSRAFTDAVALTLQNSLRAQAD